MYTFEEILNESTEKADYESLLSRLFKSANMGTLKKSGIEAVQKQIETGKLDYCGFPLWVLQSWIDPTRLGALPLKFNRWLDVQNVTNDSTDIDSDDIIFSGFVVDAGRKTESGIKAISLSRSHEVDPSKYAKLLKWKFCSLEAQRLGQHLGKGEEQSLNQNPGGTTPPAPQPNGGLGT